MPGISHCVIIFIKKIYIFQFIFIFNSVGVTHSNVCSGYNILYSPFFKTLANSAR
jgi:hypothetical protein